MTEPDLSSAVIMLMKGVVYRDTHDRAWKNLLQLQPHVRDYVEVGERLADVQAWAAEWEQAGRGPLRVEYKTVGGRLIGTNQIPCRAWLDDYDRAWEFLGTRQQVRRLAEIVEQTKAQCPRLLGWLERHPVKALDLASSWTHLLATVCWIDEHQSAGLYVRQVDVPGVDTKFIDKHKRGLTELLDLQLDPARID